MSGGPLLEEFRAAGQTGLAALEAQTVAIGRALAGRLPPSDRRCLRSTMDRLASRIASWQVLMNDEPELVGRLEEIAERVREVQAGRRSIGSAYRQPTDELR